MKTVILAGGLGTRLSEETDLTPKPMIEIGGLPILWHIMKIYGSYGFADFVIALGYRPEVVKGFFLDYYHRRNDLTVHIARGQVEVENAVNGEDWCVSLVDTGLSTQTGGRLRRLAGWLGDETFMLTYGDGVIDADIRGILDFHRAHGKAATVTAVRPPSRFGGLAFEGDLVAEFVEKPQIGEGWINGGFFVFEPRVLDYIEDDDTILEREPLERLADDGQLVAYRHEGFWQCMDTLRDKRLLEGLWDTGDAPWKVWS